MEEEKKFKAFVIMPSGNHKEYDDGPEEAKYIYDRLIVPALNDSLNGDVEIILEMNNMEVGAINKSIVKNTAISDIAIVDITGGNPNVFFELGMRFVFKPSTTILLMQKGTYIPFDIKNYRCIPYSLKYDGVKEAIEKIKSLVTKSIYNNANQTIDSLVYDVYPNLEVKTFIQKNDNARFEMPWSIYWSQIQITINVIKKSNFKPDVIFGVSNGGMLVADSIARLAYGRTQIPVLSLWANRMAKSNIFFNNEINLALISKIKKTNTKILLVDDLIATGSTFYKAKNFFNENLQNPKIYYLPLFSRNLKHLDKIYPETIWNLSQEVKDNLEKDFSFVDFCYTEYLHLPYSKEINQNK